nr:MAG TPA: hypothetical protein [Caudoviricetes sp.]
MLMHSLPLRCRTTGKAIPFLLPITFKCPTMKEIKKFNSPMFGELRVTRNEKGELLFCLKDVCNSLGLQVGATAKRLGGDINSTNVSSITVLDANNHGQQMYFVTEPDLYRCIFQSRKPTARKFQDWVFNEVLPSLRTTGAYVVTKEEDSEEDIIARGLIAAKAALARREEHIKELEEQGRRQEIVIEQKDAQIDAQDKQIKIAAPKADYYDKTLASKSCMTTTQVADDLHTTAHTLNRKLQEIGIIYSQSGQWHLKMPYKKWNLAGTRTYNYQSSNGEVVTKVTLVWNQRGKRFILALYNNNFDVKQAIAEIKGDISNK